jgi:hypothetical protein
MLPYFLEQALISYIPENLPDYYLAITKKQPQAKRQLIGTLDSDTIETIPTNGHGRKHKKNPEAAKSKKPEPVPIEMANHRFYDATYLLNEIDNTLGLTDLQTNPVNCFLYDSLIGIAACSF